ncbi:MAG: hypothetical protein AAF363_01530 [Bacteroidota bacterium]
MIKTFTQNDLISFIYNETSREKKEEIEKALLCDIQLQEEINKLKEAVKSLDEVVLNPSNKVINNILKYSESISLHPSKP